MVDDLLAAGAVIYISRFRSFDNLGSARLARQTFASEPTWLVISVMFCVSVGEPPVIRQGFALLMTNGVFEHENLLVCAL